MNLYVSIRCIFIHDIPDGSEIYHYFSIKGVIDHENYRISRSLSTERDVSLSSAAGICRTLLEKGHDAFLLDVFMGLEHAPENLEDVFTLPDHGLDIVKNISTEEPDLAAVKHPARISLTAFSVRMSSSCAALQILLSSAFMAERERMESFRLHSIFLALSIPDRILSDVPLPCTRALQSRSSLSPV